MSATSLNLVVLRVPDLERAVAFYSCFGLAFTKHTQGKGPEHYAAELGTLVFELYPQTSNEASSKHTRIGFQVANASAVLSELLQNGGSMISTLKDSPWGSSAIVDDPFGHRIEVSESKR